MILLISASQGAGITGVHHHALPSEGSFNWGFISRQEFNGGMQQLKGCHEAYLFSLCAVGSLWGWQVGCIQPWVVFIKQTDWEEVEIWILCQGDCALLLM
jgi:hypothetical protein